MKDTEAMSNKQNTIGSLKHYAVASGNITLEEIPSVRSKRMSSSTESASTVNNIQTPEQTSLIQVRGKIILPSVIFRSD